MQRIAVASRIMYKLYLVAIAASILILTVIFFIAFEKGAYEAIIALAAFSAILTVQLFFFINKSVWLVIEGDLVRFGNLFFKKEINIQEIISCNSYFFLRNVYSIKIESGKYYFISYMNRKIIKELLCPKPNC